MIRILDEADKLELEQEISKLSNEIDNLKGNFEKTSINLFNKNDALLGYYFDINNFVVGTNNSNFLCYVPISHAGTYQLTVAGIIFSLKGACRIPCFNAEKEYVSYLTATTEDTEMSDINRAKLIITEDDISENNIAYIGLTGRKTALDVAMVVEANEYPENYIPYKEELFIPELAFTEKQKEFLSENSSANAVLYTEQDLTDEQKEQARLNLWSKVPSVNMFNPATLIRGYYIDNLNGTLNANADIYYTYIPIPNTGNYIFKVARNKLGPYQSTFIPLFDADKNFVRYVKVTPLEDNETTEGQLTLMTLLDSDIINIKYFGFNVYKTEINKAMVVEGTEYPASYIPYSEVVGIPELKINSESMEKKQDNPLYKKVVAFTGDSICNGREDNGGSYPAIIGTSNSMIVQNLGISGGKITSGTESFCISESVLNMREDADYVILEGGVNDMAMNNLGTISNNFTAELDTTTFCGAFEQMLKNAIARFPGKKIGYISVHRLKQWAPDEYNTVHQNTGYYEAAINICKKWGIPVCDLTINCPSLYENDSLKQMYTTNADGWHPNEEGYRKYYVPKIEAWMKTL